MMSMIWQPATFALSLPITRHPFAEHTRGQVANASTSQQSEAELTARSFGRNDAICH